MVDTQRKIAFLAEGNSDIPGGAFSGTAYELVGGMRHAGHHVKTFDADVYGVANLLLAARTFSLNRERWRAAYRLGGAGFAARSRLAQSAVDTSAPFDLIFQVGATFASPRVRGAKVVLYCDWNMACAMHESNSGFAPPVDARRAQQINEREREVYEGADLILTISERLRQSFIVDYQISPDKVVASLAGSNTQLPYSDNQVDEMRSKCRTPTVVFSAKEFERKGGPAVLEIMARVRKVIPDARLVTLGFPPELASSEGVLNLGVLNKSDPDEFEKLVQAFVLADVFLLPTRYDPFPTVVREAMQFGLPSVTSNIWALTEMVDHGRTGYALDLDDTDGMAMRVIELLRDKTMRQRMGGLARDQFRQKFAWSAVNDSISQAIARLD